MLSKGRIAGSRPCSRGSGGVNNRSPLGGGGGTEECAGGVARPRGARPHCPARLGSIWARLVRLGLEGTGLVDPARTLLRPASDYPGVLHFDPEPWEVMDPADD